MSNKISKATMATTFLHCIVGSINKKESSTGNTVVYMRVATHRKINKEEHTDWHNIVAYGNLAKIIDTYIKKGQRLTIEGEMEVWEFNEKDEDNNDVITKKNYIRANKVDFKSEAMISIIGFVGGVSRKDEDSPLYIQLQTTRKILRDDEKIDKIDWHTITLYGKLADTIEQYAQKGTKLSVVGTLETVEINDKKLEKTFVRARRVKFL